MKHESTTALLRLWHPMLITATIVFTSSIVLSELNSWRQTSLLSTRGKPTKPSDTLAADIAEGTYSVAVKVFPRVRVWLTGSLAVKAAGEWFTNYEGPQQGSDGISFGKGHTPLVGWVTRLPLAVTLAVAASARLGLSPDSRADSESEEAVRRGVCGYSGSE